MQNRTLAEAARFNDITDVRYFLNQGKNVNRPDEWGDIALIEAARHGNIEMIHLLLEHKADINIKDNDGISPLIKAASDVNIKNRSTTIQALLEKKAEVDITDRDKITPLGWAAMNGDTEAVDLLLKYKANIYFTTDSGNVLTMATHLGRASVVELLLKLRKLDINYQEKRDHYTSLMLAANFGYAEVAQKLLEYKADPNCASLCQVTALMLAASRGYESIVQMLLASQAEVNRKDYRGHTALSEAAANGSTSIVSMLLDKKADPTITDHYRHTPMTEAMRGKHTDIIDMLKKAESLLPKKMEAKESILKPGMFSNLSLLEGQKKYSYQTGKIDSFIFKYYAREMAGSSLSSDAIHDFACAMERNDLDFIKKMFSYLNSEQKKGLLTLKIDFSKITNDPDIHLSFGFPIQIAREKGHFDLEEFLIAESKVLGIVKEAQTSRATLEEFIQRMRR